MLQQMVFLLNSLSALAACGRLRGSAVISSLLAGGWSIVEGARLAGFGMLMCSHYAGGVYFLIMLLLFARFSLSLFASVKAWPLLWTVWAILLPGGGSFSNIISNHGMGGADFSCQAGA